MADVPEMETRISELNALVSTMSTTVDQWTGRLKDDIDALKATVEPHDLVALSSRLDTVEGRLDSMSGDIRALQSAQQGLQRALEVDHVVVNGVHLPTADAVMRLLTRVEDLERVARTNVPNSGLASAPAASAGQTRVPLAHNVDVDVLSSDPERDNVDPGSGQVESLKDTRKGRKSHKSSKKSRSSRHAKSSRSRKSRKSRRRSDHSDQSSSESDSDDSLSDSEDTSSHGTSSDDSDSSNETRMTRDMRAISGRKRGPAHKGLKVIRPTNPLFRKVLNYQFYRLRNRRLTRSSLETGKVKDHLKRLELTFRGKHFNGDDPVSVFGFLADLVVECDILAMSEGQAYVALPHLLRGSAEEHFKSVRSMGRSDDGGVRCWPEAVQYLLRTYATPSHLREALSSLRDTRQRDNEDERSFSTRLSKAVARCGHVHSREEKITLYVDGLSPTIKSLVSRYHEKRRRATFLDVVQYAEIEGDAYRERARALGPRAPAKLSALPTRDNQRPTRASAMLMDTPEGSSFADTQSRAGDAMLLADAGGSSIPTSSLPTDTASEQTQLEPDPALSMYGRNRPPHDKGRVTFQPSGGRPPQPGPRPTSGARAPQSGGASPAPPSRGIICHVCYVRDKHIAPQCDLSLRELASVVSNYDGLTAEEKSRVPAHSYVRAKAALKAESNMDTPAPSGN